MSAGKKKFTQKAKKRGIIAGLVTGGILEAVFGGLIEFLGVVPFIRLDTLANILLIAISAAVGYIVAIMNNDMDLTPHNDKKQKKMEQEMESLGHSGDENADAVIQKGQEMLRQIRAANTAIPDPTLTHQMYELEYQCLQIFKTVQENPNKAPQIRKFMNYYLPTTLKMLENYRIMQDRGVSAKDLEEARNTLVHGMNMILTVGQKQIDNLYKGDMLDISTDIDVLEQMLKRDGFTDGGLGNVPKGDAQPAQAPRQEQHTSARTAAAAQMGDSLSPTLEVPQEDEQDTYRSNHTYHYKAK